MADWPTRVAVLVAVYALLMLVAGVLRRRSERFRAFEDRHGRAGAVRMLLLAALMAAGTALTLWYSPG